MAALNNQVNFEALDRRVKNLIENTNEAIEKSFIPHLLTLKKALLELRRDLWPVSGESSIVRDHRVRLYTCVGRINMRINAINAKSVQDEIDIAHNLVEKAQLDLKSPNLDTPPDLLVESVVRMVRKAILILDHLTLTYYLRQHLADHAETIAAIRHKATPLQNRITVFMIVSKQQEALRHAARRLAAEVLHEQQQKLAREIAKANLLLSQFWAAINRQDLELAERLYHSFATYGPQAHMACFGPQNDSAMQLRRMADKVRGLKQDWFGRKVPQL